MSEIHLGSLSLTRLSIERPVLTWIVILFCLLGGLHGFNNVGRLEDPAFTIKEAIIFTAYPGATALEVEQEVTEPLEIALQQMSEVDEILSESAPGISEIHVVIDETIDSADLPEVWTDLRAKISDALRTLPPGAATPVVFDDFGDTYGIYFAVTAQGYSDDRILNIARMLRRELLVVEGVAKVEVEGEPEERIYIEISQETLFRLGLSYETILQALRRESSVVTAGSLAMNGHYLRIDIPQTLSSTEAINNILISPRHSGETVRLSDIATVQRTTEQRPLRFIYHDNVPAFTLGVAGRASTNIIDVGRAVEERLAELERDLPLGVELHPIYQQHVVVDAAINDFLLNLLMSVIIVISVLFLFMGWRAGLAVGSVLILTIAGTFFFMSIFSLEMERISLGALIIAMGMLVDNAIVVTEGMLTNVRLGKPRLAAAEDAVSATQWPLLGATIIGIMAFAGIGLSPDQTGEFLFSLFAVIGISLMLSWLLAVTVVPMIGFSLFSSQRKATPAVAEKKFEEHDLYSGAFFSIYRSVLDIALKQRWLVLITLIVTTAACYAGMGSMKSSFFPETSMPLFFVNLELPEGVDILTTDESVREIGDFIGEQPETLSFNSYAGSGAMRFTLIYIGEQPSTSYGQIIVRTASTDDIADLRMRILTHVQDNYPDIEIRIDRIVFGPPTGGKLEARFAGPDVNILRALSEDAIIALHKHTNVIDIRSDWRNQTPIIHPVIVDERAQTIGVTRENIATALLFATDGIQVGVYREDDSLIPMIARASTEERADAEGLLSRLIWSSTQQAYVPMRQVISQFDLSAEDTLIQRRDRVRTISVRASPRDGETVAEGFVGFQRVIVDAIDLPNGYTLEWGGEYEASTDAKTSLGGQLPLALAGMLIISFALFAKVRQPLIIWAIVPMAVVGVVIGHLLTNIAFSFTALLGLLSLSGMLIKNAIVLVDEIDCRIATGARHFLAVRDGAVSRLRPVLLASVTTILGMVPLLFDAFFQSMAVTIISGLAFATVLTMVAIPVLYSLFFGIRPEPKESV